MRYFYGHSIIYYVFQMELNCNLALFVQNIASQCVHVSVHAESLTKPANHTANLILCSPLKQRNREEKTFTQSFDQVPNKKISTIKFRSHRVNLRSIKISNFPFDVINTFVPFFSLFPGEKVFFKAHQNPNTKHLFVEATEMHYTYSSFSTS